MSRRHTTKRTEYRQLSPVSKTGHKPLDVDAQVGRVVVLDSGSRLFVASSS